MVETQPSQPPDPLRDAHLDDPLIAKYNPVLVILPQDPKRHRPWSRWGRRVTAPRGDYHPCPAEFFLTFVSLRRRPRPWIEGAMREVVEEEPLGLERLREVVSDVAPEETADWEIDLAPIRSQDPVQAWPAYAEMLLKASALTQPVVYGRRVNYTDKTCLQYWFLYAYNDAPNKHEGDWEMVTIELSREGLPLRAGYAGHASGFQRPWSGVKTIDGRPVVYVARGSHAAYFEHRKRGHRGNSLPSPKGLPMFLEVPWLTFTRVFQTVVFFLRLNDRTASGPGDPVTDRNNVGQVLRPTLRMFPEPEAAGGNDFWWMRLNCPWGSRHSRLFGTIAPLPAWVSGQRWDDPSGWIDGLPEDRKGPARAN